MARARGRAVLRPHGWLLASLMIALCGGPLGSPTASALEAYSMASANRYLQARQWDALLAYVQRWTRDRPNEPQAWFYLGETYSIGFERPAQAVGPLQRAVQLKPDWPQAWNSLGLVQTKLKQHRSAAQAFAKAVQQSPGTMNYWFNLASAQSDLGDFGAAQATLQRGARSAGPSTGYADWYNLGLGFDQLHDYGDAANAYAEAVRRNPRLAEGWNNLGASQQKLGRADMARASYRRAIALGHGMAAGNLRRLDQGERSRADMARSQPTVTAFDQYLHKRSCDSGGNGVLGPC